MEYVRAGELSFEPRPQMGRIFTEGFYQWLKYFAKDKEKLTRALTHAPKQGGFEHFLYMRKDR